MSTIPSTARDRPADTVAGFLAVLAMVGGAIAAIQRPVSIGVAAILIAFLAVALADQARRLAAVGFAFASLGFFTGMVVCAITSRPLW